MFFTMSHHGFCFVKNKIAKLNRIAVKLQQPEIQFELIKSEMETDVKTGISQKKYYIFCVGEAPRLKDFSFQGTLEYTPRGNLIFPVNENSSKIPESFRTSEFVCEDCKVKRFRTQLFILHNEKEDKWFSVGSTCLSSFLGVNESDVNQLSEFASTLASLKNTMDKWISKTNNSKKNNSYHGYKIEDLFASLFAYMREFREKRPYQYITGYSFSAFSSFLYTPCLMIAKIKDADKVMAERLLNYYRNGGYQKPTYSNYKNTLFVDNMLVALKNDLIAKRHYKFVREAFRTYINTFHRTLFPIKEVPRSIIATTPSGIAYAPKVNAVTQVAVKPVPTPVVTLPSNYIGEVGKQVELNLDTVVTHSSRARRGSFIVLKDFIGNELSWLCPYFYRVNDKIRVNKAFIFKHVQYKGVCQTVITNVSFTKGK